MPARIIRDAQGRIIHYHATTAPSQTRLRALLRQSEQQGAKRVGLVEKVQHFQGYEMRGTAPRMLWSAAGHAMTPGQLRERIKGPGSLHATASLLNQAKHATGAEHISGLQAFDLNFQY